MFTTILYDQTSTAGGALDTGSLAIQQIGIVDVLSIEVMADDTYTGEISLYDPDLSSTLYLINLAGAGGTTAVNTIGWGPGVGGPALSQTKAVAYLGGLPAPLPPHVQVKCAASGSVTLRMRIIGFNTSGR